MRAIRDKIKSQRGASITFALLLFLVCAILSSVIIVAGSTASGRMSGLAGTDRRYYAVTSAAELMKELMDGKSVAVVKVTTSYSTVTYTDGTPGDPVENMNGNTPTEPVTKEYLLADSPIREAGEIDLDTISAYEVKNATTMQNDSVQNAAGYAYLKQTALDNKPLELKSDLKVGTPEIDPLEVSITAGFDKNGNITLTVSDKGDNPMRQKLVLHADTSVSTYLATEELAPVVISSEGEPLVEKIPTKTTMIELATLSWDGD